MSNWSSKRSGTIRDIAAAQIRAGAVCTRCGRPMIIGEPFHADHLISRAEGEAMGMTDAEIDNPSNVGPAHPKCNMSAGGKQSHSKRAPVLRARAFKSVERPKFGLVFPESRDPLTLVPTETPSSSAEVPLWAR